MRSFSLVCIQWASCWLLTVTMPAAGFHLRVTDTSGRPVESAVAWVDDVRGAAPAPRQFQILQKNRRFIPDVSVVPVGSVATFPNQDSVQHQVYSFSPAKKFDIPLYIGESPTSIRFDRSGIVTLGCNIHDWMAAYVLVLNTVYYSTTDSAGRVTIGVPFQGATTLRVWHPRLRGAPVAVRAVPNGEIEVELRLKPVFRRTPPALEGGSYR